jgi:hypothetical protein
MIQIDNPTEAQALADRLTAAVPFQVRAGNELMKTMRNKGDRVTADTVFKIHEIKYTGDSTGIQCGLAAAEGKPDLSEKYSVSLTQLKIDPEHALTAEVQAYQQNRLQRLKVQAQTGFAASVKPSKTAAKRSTSKGFGK